MTSTPRPFRLLVFDWDGTLMDSAATIAACVAESFRELDLAPPPDHEIRSSIGLGLEDTLDRLAPDSSEDERQQLVVAYRKHWFSTYQGRPSLFARVPETLETLAGQDYWLAVATGKGRMGLDRDLEATGLGPRFLTTRTAYETPPKPDPQMLLDIMNELGVHREQTLMIGDTTFDLTMARAAGVAAVGVLTGTHPRPHLMSCEPLTCLENVAELPEWLGRVER